MTTKFIARIIAAVVGVVGLGAFGSVLLFAGGANSPCIAVPTSPAPSASGGATPALTTGGPTTVRGYDSEQVTNATTIITVGQRFGVPPRGWVIAIATALQESALRAGTTGNQDSIGLFQQRPSQGWGTPDQLRDPTYAATKFYQKLLAIPNWESMPLTDVAQAVQRSAFPSAYAKWEPDATLLVDTLAGGAMELGDQCGTPCAATASSAKTPLGSMVTSGTAPLIAVRLAAAPAGPAPSPSGGCLAAQAILARAQTWLTGWDGGPVPYLSSNIQGDLFQGYRRDCSGYASMALGLPGPGLDTADLANKYPAITKEQIQPGDLLINPAPGGAGHVVIFDHWTDASMTSYVGYEQSGDGGTHHRTIPYPYFGSYWMQPHSP
ncbi:hypothetical protein [Rugosimonospora africana]|uniref:NlpC/P60 domain-containing protein n=1 Tax=Rugosimonospora africana TaxID=556532 RepID=A0A8J3QU96_9ACTN|nr:hypothetical protein [Rugosimonospora africana]GIH16117.1 hypothetical protein Raf01_42890 [Rugosimonospora africana]